MAVYVEGPQIGVRVPAPDPSKMPSGSRWPTDLQSKRDTFRPYR